MVNIHLQRASFTPEGAEDDGGAYVLAVQTPTLWMDNVLFAAIEDYVNSNSDIDTNRIYVGGCSNGGYMTLDLIFEHGDYFAAYYPIYDTTVDPFSTSIPSFYRLIKAVLKMFIYTLTDKVRGTDDPNATYMVITHEDGNMWSWMASQSK
ncbi:hypothetical protein BCR32DRAFT_288524 [Anaeromyces robustus]|uniref:Peptidase S9 prolyl oligopeptidase catalytic domain-containing protein n=1 Tax=Anaeromyces robustus TaxID=1754192 RepID=A0A1Y1UPN9_9FUNG|nr:hypothetical protein BCR32DRAFT_288524 [Anaeromyces robustus]|eukprot:ORX39537.1 hypothetical protein BCR32DRAFT_288524 [Anaeromyces robustus]